MRRVSLFVAIAIAWSCLALWLSTKKADRVPVIKEEKADLVKADLVLVVKGEDASVMGQVEFVNVGGKFRPNVWKPGAVVIFREDGNFGDQPGKAGTAYKINENLKLERIGTVDLNKPDEELAAEFGVTAGGKE